MKEIYLQNYLVENYTLIAMVVGTYFVVTMESAVDVFIKKRMVINMTLLLILSMSEFYMNYLKDQAVIGLALITTGIIYYSLKPLVMAILINMVDTFYIVAKTMKFVPMLDIVPQLKILKTLTIISVIKRRKQCKIK